MSIIFDQLRISDDGDRMYINLHVNRADYFKDIYLDSLVITTADKVLETDPGMPSSDYIYKEEFNGVKDLNLLDFSKIGHDYVFSPGDAVYIDNVIYKCNRETSNPPFAFVFDGNSSIVYDHSIDADAYVVDNNSLDSNWEVYQSNTTIKEADIVINLEVLNAAFNNWNGSAPINPSKPYATLAFNKANLSKDLFFIYVKIKGVPDPCTPCRLDEEITVGVTFDENMLYQRVMDYTKGLADDCNIPVGFTDFILLWNAFKASIETEHYVPAIKYWSMLFNTSNSFTYHTTKPCGCHG